MAKWLPPQRVNILKTSTHTHNSHKNGLLEITLFKAYERHLYQGKIPPLVLPHTVG
jgi:hypothetical protein